MTLVPTMTRDEMEDFLNEPQHLARIATIDVDGIPRVVPSWFILHKDQIIFTPRKESTWYENIRRDPRVGLSIDEDVQPYRKVIVQGEADVLYAPGNDDAWRDLYERICNRYFPTKITKQYLVDFGDLARPLLGIRLNASRVTTWRMPHGEEARSGIMARRYYPDTSKMARQADTGTADAAYFPTPIRED
jgi:nitroimidazol reductase NimA-like FMN-containing flavoprotein (pyridoxamine 5'-phosphate oxidase superfamily)